ncbi:hypothetical protein Tco_0704507 [Tanacetum coccineum]|uniref:Mitochondrial protein n=1 Tax=Tanacetum coccineum TaxID=301880 RepID=A0ABQ4Y281_9ASTR
MGWTNAIALAPMATKPKLDAELSGTPVDQTIYQSLIGSLMYLTSSRPDLVQAIYYYARYQARPTKKHHKKGLEIGSIRRIQGIGYGVLEFLAVGTTFDIFQNIHILYIQYGVLVFRIRRIDLLSFVVFGECRHGYAVSSLMDTAYW